MKSDAKISRERYLPGFPDFSRYVVGTNKTRKRLSNLIQDKQGNNKVLDRICNSFLSIPECIT